MITDDELNDLPSDPELAFVAVEKILRARVDEAEFDARNNDYDVDPFRFQYMTRVAAAAKAYNVEALDGLVVPKHTRSGIYDDFQQFKNDVDYVTMQIRMNAAQMNRAGSVSLGPNMKRKVHHFIQQIRDLIEENVTDIPKKEELLKKLNQFAAEVDRDRTRLVAAMAFFTTFCAGVGDGFEKLKPVREMFDSISRLLGQAQQLENHYAPGLTAPTERKRLAPPPKPEPKSEIDDNIPF